MASTALAATDTWGISGPTFLWFYAALAAFTVAGVLLRRLRYSRGPNPHQPIEFTPTQAALLSEGRRLAILASLAWLRTAAVTGGERGYLRQLGPLPAGASELDRAVYQAAGRKASRFSLSGDPAVQSALRREEERLIADGWLLGDDQVARLRTGAALILAVGALGAVRAIAGALNDRPVGYLLLLLVPVIGAGVLLMRVKRVPDGSRRMLQRMRGRARHLVPSRRPAWTTYGPGAAALSVGLYGVAVFWASDPGFAEAAELPRSLGAAGGGGYSTCGGGSTAGSTGTCGGGGGGGGGCSGGGGCGG